MSRAACTCERYQLTAPDGTLLEGELRRDPDCRQHGFPTDQWPAGHPLRRHARTVWRTAWEPPILNRAGEILVIPDERIVQHLETPREVEARLYRESLRSAA